MKGLIDKIKGYSIINNKKRILKNYYSKQMRKGKTYRASLLDKAFLIIIFFIAIMILLYWRTDNFLLSFFMSTITIYFLAMSGFIVYKKSKTKKINSIKENLRNEKLLKELYSLNNEGFKAYIKDLFEKYYNTKLDYGEFPVDLIGEIEDEEYKIKCLKLESEDKVSLRDINPFLKEIKIDDVNEGIIVTNSFFTEEVKEINGIITYDLKKIIEMTKETKLYPTDNEIENYIINSFLDNRNEIKKQIRTIDKNKIIKLYSISMIFYFFSYLVGYKSYYKIMSFLILIIAIILSAYKFSEYIIIKDRSPFT